MPLSLQLFKQNAHRKDRLMHLLTLPVALRQPRISLKGNDVSIGRR